MPVEEEKSQIFRHLKLFGNRYGKYKDIWDQCLKRP